LTGFLEMFNIGSLRTRGHVKANDHSATKNKIRIEEKKRPGSHVAILSLQIENLVFLILVHNTPLLKQLIILIVH